MINVHKLTVYFSDNNNANNEKITVIIIITIVTIVIRIKMIFS